MKKLFKTTMLATAIVSPNMGAMAVAAGGFTNAAINIADQFNKNKEEGGKV